MMRWQQNRGRASALLLAAGSTLILAVGCGFSSDVVFGDGQQTGFNPLDPLGTSSGQTGTSSGGGGGSSGNGASGGNGSSGQPIPATCTDGLKNGNETDVDCGVSCAAPCANGKECALGDDCSSLVCTGNHCQPPTGSDGVKNGDESGIDCGGTLTGAARCVVGQTCALNSDCETRGCSNGVCIEAPSCAVQLGGTTCGANEVGSGAEVHESCCTSLEVPGFSDADHPGKRVFLDKYEITAGRMRAFVAAMTEQFAGQPNINAFISAAPPPRWQPGWTQFMPSGTDGAIADTPNGVSQGCGPTCNVGTNFIFGATLYQYSHGHNCYIGDGAYGFSTYWHPDDVAQNQQGGRPRAYSQDILDVKSLNCTPNVMFAAFCHWDGGQLATWDVLSELAGDLAGDGITSGDGSQISGKYYYPGGGNSADDAARVAAPGRYGPDATMHAGAGPWMDLRGNLNETTLDGGAFKIALPFGGLGQGSAHAGNNDAGWIAHAEHKSGMVGGRCMRFKN